MVETGALRAAPLPRRGFQLEPPAGVCQTHIEQVNEAPKQSGAKESAAGDIGAGHILGRYELLLPIAAGGMAMVWAARMTGTRGFQKIVAVKTMLPKLCEDDQFEQMFLAEAALASQIHHPHVGEILDLGEHEGILYLVMEWIDGVALNQMMKGAKKTGGIPLPIAVRVIMQACAGLHAAHELKDRKGQLVGLVHRDVSPQNIMVTYDGVTKVVDFGIAKATAMGDGATVAGQIKGKVAYMAPEQVKGGSIDRRVDVFAAAIVLYALTTGKHPLRRETEAATMYNICSPDPVMPPSKIIASYPPALERVVMTALAKDPAKRYPTCNDFLRALDQALPANLRASTDEDVGAFVKGLFGDKRAEREAALSEALDLANKQRESRVDLAAMAEHHGTNTPVSSVSLNAPGGATDPSLSGQSGSTLAAGALEAQGAPRRRLAIGALTVGLVLVGALALVAVIRGNKGNTVYVMSAAPPVAAAPPTPSATDPQASAKDGGKEEGPIALDTIKPAGDEAADPEAKPGSKKVAKGGPAVAPGFTPPAAPPADAPPKPAAPAAPKPANTGNWDRTSGGF
jgi:eukaryotic-like serine/threonine-protein kinase